MPTYYCGVDIDRMPQEWHVNYRKSKAEEIATERKLKRHNWTRTAPYRRADYTRIVGLTTVELISEVASLGGGDDYDGCFTRQGEVTLSFAKRTLRLRIRQLETANAALVECNEEVDWLRKAAEDTFGRLRLEEEATGVAERERDAARAEADQLREYINERRDFESEWRADNISLRAEIKRLQTALADAEKSNGYARSEMARLQRLVGQMTQRS